jgi:hypothetical protein
MLDLTLESAYRVRLQTRGLPSHSHEPIILYLVYGYAPGHFLEAVLANDLAEAVKRCDQANEAYLCEYVKFLHQCAPAQAWGSPERVWTWIASHANDRVRR